MTDFENAVRAASIAAFLLTIAGCGGGDAGSAANQPANSPMVDPPPAAITTLSGRISFDRVPLTSAGLAFTQVQDAPARQVVVEAIRTSDSAVLASTTTDASGNYSLAVPISTNLFVRAKAQMLQSGSTPSWNIRVLDNADGNKLYALDGAPADSGTAPSVRNLRAPSGWSGSSYTGTRAAAPFAVLDTVYRAKERLLSAQSTLMFPPLDLFWSATNRASPGTFCPVDGLIGTTSFVTTSGSEPDDCSPNNTVLAGIYVLGEMNDTDEFDQHVIAHEFGHYVEAVFSRSDSIGGHHGSGDRLDARLAFGEGWGNAFSAMVLNDPVYKDSFGLTGPANGFSVEQNDGDPNRGWFSELSVSRILWDVFDNGPEPGDTVQLGFTPIFTILSGVQKNTDALTTIYSFMQGLRTQNASYADSIGALENAEEIRGRGEFVETVDETNHGGDVKALPLYTFIQPNSAPVEICTTATYGKVNKLNNRRFLRLELTSAAAVVVTANASPADGVQASDPDIYVWRRGQLIAQGLDVGSNQTTPQRQLASGVYVIEVLDYAYVDPATQGNDPTPRCMAVSVAAM